MSEPAKKGWLKTLIGTATGLMSGAAVMWFTPLLDKVVKPSKPIANFAVEHNGMTVTFVNKSSGGGQGRWDFGDGSPLEFVKADQPTVEHTYRNPGDYTVKYTLTNLLGDENERAVTVKLKNEKPQAPKILDLNAKSPSRNGLAVFAPATFNFEAIADNAELYIWDFGEGKGVVRASHQTSHTYTAPGTYTVRLAAFNADQKSQHDVIVDVYEPPSGILNVSVKVADQGTQVETRRRETVVSQAVTLTGENDPETIEQVLTPSAGFEFVNIERKKSQSENVGEARWQIALDGKSAKIFAAITNRDKGQAAILNEHLALIEQRKDKTSRDPIRAVNTLSAPGSASLLLPPIPEDWTEVQRQYAFEIRRDGQLIWAGQELPQNVPIRLGDRTYTLTALPKGERVQVSVSTGVAMK